MQQRITSVIQKTPKKTPRKPETQSGIIPSLRSHAFQFFTQRRPVRFIQMSLVMLFFQQLPKKPILVFLYGKSQKGPLLLFLFNDIRILPGKPVQKLRRLTFLQPKSYLFVGWIGLMAFIIRFYEPPYHGPIFVSLGFFGCHQVRQGQNANAGNVRKINQRPPRPKLIKIIAAAHDRHDIHPEAIEIRMPASEMTGMPSLKENLLKRGEKDLFCVKGFERRLQSFQVFIGAEDNKIRIPAEFRCPVKDARLPPHQEGFDVAFPESRKDFENRVPAQGILRQAGKTPTDVRSTGNVPMASCASTRMFQSRNRQSS